jgi:hypothetical protein
LLIALLTAQTSILKEIRGNIYVFIISLTSLLLFLFIPGNNILDYKASFYQPYKQQWREATKYVLDNYSDNSIIFGDRHPLLYIYYLNKHRHDNRLFYINHYDSMVPQNVLNRVRQRHDRIFVFSSFEKLPLPIEMSFKKSFPKCTRKDFLYMYIYDCTY